MSQLPANRFGHFIGRLPRPFILSLFMVAFAAITTAPSKAEEVKPKTLAEKKAQHEKWFGSSTIVAAKRAVKTSLKDPGSAEFKGVYANYTEEYGVVACGYVNARNGFGGYTGYKAFVSSGQSVIMEGRDQITKAWRAACNTQLATGKRQN